MTPLRNRGDLFPPAVCVIEKWDAVRKQEMDGARYINEYEDAKGFAIAAGVAARKEGKNRARDQENERRTATDRSP